MLFIILLSVPLELGTVLGTMRCKIFLPLLLFTVVTALLPAQAQVQRCTDARTGKVTYTDGSCSADQRSQEVVPALSPQEKAAQERQYEEAQARWQVEQARTQAQRRLEAEKAAAQAAAAEQKAQAEKAKIQAAEDMQKAIDSGELPEWMQPVQF